MKNISRIDNDESNTHQYFARVYRGSWTGPRSFSDNVYGSKDAAERAALAWVKRAEAGLPIIPPMPVLKIATFKLRNDASGSYYYVYLPLPAQRKRRGQGRAEYEEEYLYFSDTKTKDKQAAKAFSLITARNEMLERDYRLSFIAWQRQREKIMQTIRKRWTKLKAMKIRVDNLPRASA